MLKHVTLHTNLANPPIFFWQRGRTRSGPSSLFSRPPSPNSHRLEGPPSPGVAMDRGPKTPFAVSCAAAHFGDALSTSVFGCFALLDVICCHDELAVPEEVRPFRAIWALPSSH